MPRKQGRSKERTHSYLFTAAALALFMLATPAASQETQPGDACSSAGQFRRVGGPEDAAGGHFMVCDGSNWLSLLDYEDTGQIHFQVGNDTNSCTSAKQGRLRYGSGSDLWEYCDGTNWLDFGSGSGGGSGLWTAGTDDTIYYNSGAPLVGIGTDSPNGSLHIVSGVGGSGDAAIRIEADTDNSDDSDNPYIFFSQDGGGKTSVIGMNGPGENPLGNAYTGTDHDALLIGAIQSDIALQFGTSNTVRLTIDAQGQLGIGDVAPDASLEIVKDGASPYFGLSSSVSADGDVFIVDAAGNVGIGDKTPDSGTGGQLKLDVEGNAGAVNFCDENGDNCFSPADAGGLWTAGSGDSIYYSSGTPKVGIGTASPEEELDVKGQIQFAAQRGNNVDKQATLLMPHHLSGSEEQFMIVAGVSDDIGSNRSQVIYGGGFSAYNAATGHRFFTAPNYTTKSGTERMRIDSDGNVGIGTASPEEKLDVVGNTRITGTTSDPASSDNTEGPRLVVHNTTDGSWTKGTGMGGLVVTSDEVGGGAVARIDAVHAISSGSQSTPDVGWWFYSSSNGTLTKSFEINRGPYLRIPADNIALGFGTADGFFSDATITFDGTNLVFNASAFGNNDFEFRSGNVGIGTASPNVELDVIGDIEYTGTIQDVSDVRLKESIEPLASEIDHITQLRPVSFVMKDGDGQQELGFIAQDVESIYPALVSTANDEMSTKSLNYVGLIAPLTRAVQELAADRAAMEEELTKRIDKLAADKAALEERLDELKARLDAIE